MNDSPTTVAVRSAGAFLALTVSLSIGIGFLIAASTRGIVPIALSDSFAVVILLSPTIAAAALTVSVGGWGGLRGLFAPLFAWRVPIRWYLVALFFPPALNLASLGTYALLGGSPPGVPGSVPDDLAPLVTGELASTLILLSGYFLLASAAEEIGWRGYALPRLQTRLSALASSLLVGAAWAFWHVPSFFLVPGAGQGEIPFLRYLPSVLAISVVFTWLYNNASGSVLLVTVLHASIQVSNVLFPTLPSATGDANLYALTVSVTIGSAVLLVGIYGSRNLSAGRIARRDEPLR